MQEACPKQAAAGRQAVAEAASKGHMRTFSLTAARRALASCCSASTCSALPLIRVLCESYASVLRWKAARFASRSSAARRSCSV